MPSYIKTLFAVVLFAIIQPVQAALEVDVVHNAYSQFPVTIGRFTGGDEIATIIAADLTGSGRFAIRSSNNRLIPMEAGAIDFAAWRAEGSDALVTGTVTPVEGGLVQVDFRLFDVFVGKQLEGFRWRTTPAGLRRIAHLISDRIYQRITGVPGDFATFIAYVTQSRERNWTIYRLVIADADGANAQTLLQSPEPILSPAWSPDGKRLAYVSFEQGRSRVFLHDLFTNVRTPLPVFEGVAGAPAWSPDGSSIALSMSRQGNQDIYIYTLANGRFTRITNHPNIDTEPEWAVNGQALFFTSDRSRLPQVYRFDLANGKVARMTFSGRSNASPAASSDGRYLAVIQGQANGVYHIALVDLFSGEERVVSGTRYDESPSFSPNGRMILYATEEQNRGILATVSTDGQGGRRILSPNSAVREPAWGPRISQ